MGNLVRNLGKEKTVNLTKDFDLIVDKYRKIADASGYHGELRFQKEGGFTIIFVDIKE
jgi:DNA polymerase III delta prime subunit